MRLSVQSPAWPCHLTRSTANPASSSATEALDKDQESWAVPSYSDGVTRRKTPNPSPGEGARRTKPAAGSDEYIRYDDPGSGMQQFEDDRDWHHDQRRAEGHDRCPECGRKPEKNASKASRSYRPIRQLQQRAPNICAAVSEPLVAR